ncbi:MAG: branched-chain amino acid ABC transporter permease [Ardenticatenaceae bacterium]|nr:branched-chain amino acid ABC transporter permease [Ardenticatenaceae bacterium]HBY98730.1 branched-chain amino acid ABC transporter permease [Chloroflexota bacterium]
MTRSRTSWLALAGLGLLVLFPFLAALVMRQSVDQGTPKFLQGLLIQVFILAVFAMSYDLLLGYTGILSFGHAMFYGTGAYVVGIMLKHVLADGDSATGPTLVHLAVALVVVLVVVSGQSVLFGLLSLRVKGVYFAMVTLAFAQMFFILSEATDFRQWTGAEDGLQGIPVPAAISPTDERLRFYYLTLIFMVLMYLFARRLTESPTGRVMIAIRENEQRAAAIGYNTVIFKLIAIVVSGLMAGLAGGLMALWQLNASPTLLGVGTTIDALLMAIIGGIGTLIGPVLGAGVLELLGFYLNRTFGPSWTLILGLVFVLLVMFLPYGIVGTWRLRKVSLGRGWEVLGRRLGLVAPEAELRAER